MQNNTQAIETLKAYSRVSVFLLFMLVLAGLMFAGARVPGATKFYGIGFILLAVVKIGCRVAMWNVEGRIKPFPVCFTMASLVLGGLGVIFIMDLVKYYNIISLGSIFIMWASLYGAHLILENRFKEVEMKNKKRKNLSEALRESNDRINV